MAGDAVAASCQILAVIEDASSGFAAEFAG
jgi:hypothetical protein